MTFNCHFDTSSLAVICAGFVSYCYYNNMPQTWWLRTTQVYYLTVLQVRGPK